MRLLLIGFLRADRTPILRGDEEFCLSNLFFEDDKGSGSRFEAKELCFCIKTLSKAQIHDLATLSTSNLSEIYS